MLHDDEGRDGEDAYVIPKGTIMQPDEYRVFCCKGHEGGPEFKIGGDDAIYLLHKYGGVLSSYELPDEGKDGHTYVHDGDGKGYLQTSTPTPGKKNELTREEPSEIRARLKEQNDKGRALFGNFETRDDLESYEHVIRMDLRMEEEKYKFMMEHQTAEEYEEASGLTVTIAGTKHELTSPFVVRPSGQSTLAIATCVDTPTIPLVMKFNKIDKLQTLFGVEKVRLRHHMSDDSFMREYAGKCVFFLRSIFFIQWYFLLHSHTLLLPLHQCTGCSATLTCPTLEFAPLSSTSTERASDSTA